MKRKEEGTTIIMISNINGNKNGFKPEYIDVICLVILLAVFYLALFLTHGIWLIADVILLALTGAILGKTIGNMVKV